MLLKASWDISHGGKNISAGQEFEVNELDGQALIAIGFEQAQAETKTKTKTKSKTKTKKSAESAEG